MEPASILADVMEFAASLPVVIDPSTISSPVVRLNITGLQNSATPLKGVKLMYIRIFTAVAGTVIGTTTEVQGPGANEFMFVITAVVPL